VEGEIRLGPFPKLREATLVRCQIARLDMLEQSKQLERLDASHNRIEVLPRFLSNCQHLRSMKLSDNPFRQINLNLENMLQLEELEIKVQPVKQN
jgi:Leucine-rich repeat (LRR) protein